VKKYKVIASFVTYCSAEIEAVNEATAYAIARDMDGASFDVKWNNDDWKIERVDEIKEIK